MNKSISHTSALETGFRVGPWQADPRNNTLLQGVTEKRLENRVMRTLVFLAEHPGQVLTRAQFIDSVWHGRVVNEEALSRAVSLLRTALEDDSHAPAFIQTVPGIGYRLIANVTIAQAVENNTSDGISTGNSIAVLPFINLSDDPGNEYFSEGISEEILNCLAQVERFKVVGRTSSFVFKGKNEDLRHIGRVLDVSHVLEGSVRKSGSRVRITAQLIKTNDGFHLWSQTFDRDLVDIFSVQDEIAAAVVDELKVRILGDLGKARHTTPEAYSLYLQAQYFIRSADQQTIQKALDLFQQVTEIDAQYAPAWVGIANCYWYLRSWGLLGREECRVQISESNARALALDSQLAEAHVVYAILAKDYDQDWAAAKESMDVARQLAPSNSRVLSQAGHLASTIGQLEESVSHLERALVLDPLYTTTHIWLSMSLIGLNRLTEARNILLKALNLNPQRPVAHMLLGKMLILQGEAKSAHEEMMKEPEGFWREYGTAQSLFALGRNAKADKILQSLVEVYCHDGPFQIAEIYAFRGDKEAAFNWLKRAREEHDNGLTELFVSPAMAKLHGDARWQSFLAEMGLPQNMGSG